MELTANPTVLRHPAPPRLVPSARWRLVAAPRCCPWHWAAAAATARSARAFRAMVRARGEAEWVPKKEVLTELAASERPIGYYCLREPGSSTCLGTICEVRSSSSEAERRFQLKIAGKVEHFVVNELPFSEGKLGGHLWDGGILMSAWCASHPELFENQTILELGSGIGLLGLTLCRATSGTVVLSDFGQASEAGKPVAPERLVPARLLENLRQNVAINDISNAEVRHIDWHDYLDDSGENVEGLEGFQRLVAADVVYYSSDVPALAATMGAHLSPKGRAFVLVVKRHWRGPEASERATAEDLASALRSYGEVTVSELLGYCCTYEEVSMALIQLTRSEDA